MNRLNKKNGFTIIELVVSLLLFGFLALAGSSLIDMSLKGEKRSKLNAAKLGIHAALRKLSLRVTTGVNWRTFNRAETFHIIPDTNPEINDPNDYRLTSPLYLVGKPVYENGPAGGKPEDFYWPQYTANETVEAHSEAFNINSFALEIYRLKGEDDGTGTAAGDKESMGIIFSRCIHKDNANIEWTVDDIATARTEPLSPFLFTKFSQEDPADSEELDTEENPGDGFAAGNNVQYSIRCCDRTTAQPVCEEDPTSLDSDYRIRIFHVIHATNADGTRDTSNAGDFKVYPRKDEVKEVAGAGFLLTFNRATQPTAFDSRFFTITNECMSKMDSGIDIEQTKNCSKASTIHAWTRRATVTGIDSSGVINF